MSNTKTESATITDMEGPLYPPALEKFQEAYILGKHKHFPITEDFLRYYAEEFRMMLIHSVKFYPEFTTGDGASWMAVRISYDNVHYYILFPKGRDRQHADGTVSTKHVAFYYDGAEEVPEERVGKVAQMMFAVFEMARRDFRHKE